MIKNLTPHTVVLPGMVIQPSGIISRVSQSNTVIGNHDGIELVNTVFGAVENLPEPQNGVLYIVSAMVRMACPDRYDLASPGDLVRDHDGNIIGCRNLIVNKPKS